AQLPRPARAGAGREPRLPHPRGPERRPDRDPVGEPPRVGDRRLRRPRAPGGGRPGLPDPSAQADRVPAAGLRGGGDLCVHPGAARQGGGGAGPAARAPARDRVRRGGGAGGADGTLEFARLLACGREARARFADWRAEALRAEPGDLATIIYTSGTTGDPKGVMLSHGNITSNVVTCLTLLALSETDECLSFLPLSHIFERMVGHYAMLHRGVVINYATSTETVAAEMAEIRPTIVAAVPRLYEKIYQRVLDQALSGSALKRRIFLWARATAERWVDYVLAHRRPPP